MVPRWLMPCACIALVAIAGHARGSDVGRCRTVVSGRAEIIEFKAEMATGKRVTVRGLLSRPDGAGPFPAVVMLPGSRGPRPPGCYAAVAERFVTWGFATLLVVPVPAIDARATQLYKYETVDLGTYTHGAATALADLPRVDGSQILLWGHSRGGGAVIDAVSKAKMSNGNIRAAVAAAPWPGCPAQATPPAIPLLIQMGSVDTKIDVDSCIGYARNSKNADGFEFSLLPEAGHSYRTPGTRKYNEAAAKLAEERLKAFMAKYLRVGR